jgi:hypothetical protein
MTRYAAAKAACAEFPYRPGGANTRTREHREAALAAIRELFAVKGAAR